MRRSYLFTFILLIILIGVPIGVIWPSLLSIREMSTAIYQEYAYLEERNQRGLHTKIIQRDYDLLKDKLPMLESLSIKEDSELDFITIVESLAKSHGVTESLHLNFDAVHSKNSLTAIPLTILVRGSYGSTVSYLNALENLPTLVAVRSIHMEPAPRGAVSPNINATFEGFVYRRPASLVR